MKMTVLVHDGIGVGRRAPAQPGKFVWPKGIAGTLGLTRAQLDVLVLGPA